MPKLLVLVDGLDDGTLAMGEAVHAGARAVRFAESDLMRLSADAASPRMARLRRLPGPPALQEYDAIALGAGAAGVPTLQALLADAARELAPGALANKLGSIVPDAGDATHAAGDRNPLWPLLAPMARLGMILVPPGYAGPAGGAESGAAAAERLGRRLVDIAGWITHARSHHHH